MIISEYIPFLNIVSVKFFNTLMEPILLQFHVSI